MVNQFSQSLLRKGTKITDVVSYPWHHHWKPLALRGLKIEELTSAEELVLYASPCLALPFYSCGEVKRQSFPCVETTLALHGEKVISYHASHSCRPKRVHLLRSDWVTGLALSNHEAFVFTSEQLLILLGVSLQ